MSEPALALPPADERLAGARDLYTRTVEIVREHGGRMIFREALRQAMKELEAGQVSGGDAAGLSIENDVLREVLCGTANQRLSDGRLCWCDTEETSGHEDAAIPHRPFCLAARAALEGEPAILSPADQLDAALAVKDLAEAVERCWRLVKEWRDG